MIPAHQGFHGLQIVSKRSAFPAISVIYCTEAILHLYYGATKIIIPLFIQIRKECLLKRQPYCQSQHRVSTRR